MAWMWWVQTQAYEKPKNKECIATKAPTGKVMQIFAGHAAGTLLRAMPACHEAALTPSPFKSWGYKEEF